MHFCEEKKYDVEERPEIHEEEIRLKSFIGNYKFNSGNELLIKYDITKLTEDDFSRIIEDIAGWGGMLGPPFLKAILNFCSPLMGENEIMLAYSDLLIKYTEIALSEYLPPLIERKTYLAPTPIGKIMIPRTISHFSQGQTLFVSQRTKVNVESLPRLLMIRFHGEMIQKLIDIERQLKERQIANPMIQIMRTISRNRGYHSNFVSTGFYQNLLNRAYETDFTSSEVYQKLCEQASASSSFRDIIYLWEAFVGRRVLLSKLREALEGGYMLKPVCKLYELWCLKVVLDALREEMGCDYTPPNSLPGSFLFNPKNSSYKAKVLYNVSPPSKFLYKLKRRGAGISTGKKPDITIAMTGPSGKKVIIAADVKYRMLKNIGDEDLRRFLWYLIDYTGVTDEDLLEGMFLHLPADENIHQRVEREKPKIVVHFLGMKPEMVSLSKKALRKVLTDLFNLL